MTGDFDMLSFYGRHTMERNLQRIKIAHGNYSIGSRRGTSSHQYNPAIIIAGKDTTEDTGSCYGMVFVYSGSFLCEAEKDQFEQTRVLMGLQSDLFHYPLGNNEQLIVPETILCYSDQGFSTLSIRYHNCIRDHVCRGKYSRQPGPILVNSWETAYFNFNGETIIKLAQNAAELGIDMVVMDDGWFGKRDDDNSGLGDWNVNEKKLGCTLGELIRKVNDIGIKFGIWMEPEMVSEDSDLYRAHPDWTMQIPGRKPVRARNQLVLDFSRAEVREQVSLYKRYAQLICQGNYYRLSDPFRDAYAAWIFVSEDRKQALINVVMLENHSNMAVSYVKLKGLKADAVYEETESGRRYYGSALMEAGLTMSIEKKEYPAYQIGLNLCEGII